MSNDNTEIWKVIPGWENWYDVSNIGRVGSWKKTTGYRGGPGKPCFVRAVHRRILTQAVNNNGYYQIRLSKDHKRKTCRVHNLMLRAFVGPPRDGQISRHLNGKKLDNWIENLRWGSIQENNSDMYGHGHIRRGSENAAAVMTEEIVIELRRRRKHDGASYADLAEAFDLSKSAVGHAITGLSWAHMPGAVRSHQMKVRPKTAGYRVDVIACRANGLTMTETIHRVGCSRYFVRRFWNA